MTEINRREFLRTGVLFFIFSLTIFVNLSIPSKLSLMPSIEWTLSPDVAYGLYIAQIVIATIALVIWISCLIGVFSPKIINKLLATKVMTWVKPSFHILFPIVFLFNFFISSIHILANAAVRYEDIVFVVIYVFVFVWAFIMPHFFYYSDKKEDDSKIEVKFYCKKCGREVRDTDSTCSNCNSILSEVGKQKCISVIMSTSLSLSASKYSFLTKSEQKTLSKIKGWVFSQFKKFEISDIEIGFPSGLKIKFTRIKDKED